MKGDIGVAGRQRDVVVLRLPVRTQATVGLEREGEVAGDEDADGKGVDDEGRIGGGVAPCGGDGGDEGWGESSEQTFVVFQRKALRSRVE